MLNILIGRAGSGKSEKCIAEYNAYIQKNKGIASAQYAYFFVPEQYTMLTERRLLEYQINENYTVQGLLGHEVLNFKRFSHRILNIYGSYSAKPLNECGKIMLLTSILEECSSGLEYFKTAAAKPGEVSNILAALDEFGKYGVSWKRLSELSIDDVYLGKKIKDLSLIYKKYEEYKRNKYTDENDVFQIMLDTVKHENFFLDKSVWIDSFTGFTSKELELITVMMRSCRNITVTLCTDLSGEASFYCTDKTVEILKKIAQDNSVPVKITNLSLKRDSNSYKYTNTSIFYLEQNLYNTGTGKIISKQNVTDSIKLFEASGLYEEVIYCAESIKKLHEKNIQYKHIAVAVKDSAGYDVLIKAVFRKYNIPFYIDEKKSTDNNPLIKTVLSILSIIADNWQIGDVLECLKSRLLPLEADIDKTENYILSKGLKGKRYWSKETEKSCSELFSIIDKFRCDFVNCKNLKEASIILCKYINNWQIKERLYNISEEFKRNSDFELADEYSRIWNIFTEIIEQIVLFLGDKEYKSSEYADKMRTLLIAGTSQYKIGFIPKAIESVQIINIERSRSDEIKYLFLLGANESVIPSSFCDDGILKDSERETLEKMNIFLADKIETKAAKENYYIYTTLSLPSEFLSISWPLENISGNQMKPSPVLLRKMKNLFPAILIDNAASVYNNAENLASLKTQIAQNITVDNKSNAELLHLNGTFFTTVSRIETYYKCPYNYFASYVLKLKEREESELQLYDMGNVMHSIINEASEEIFKLPAETETVFYENIVEKAYDKVKNIMRFSEDYLSERDKHALKRIKKYAAVIFRNAKKQVESGKFHVYGYEIPFDFNNDSLKPIVIYPDTKQPILEKIAVTGRIDRCDIMEVGGIKYIRIVDYKSSSVTLTENEIKAGTKLQLITYLNAAVSSFGDDCMPAGALYFKFGDDIASAKSHISCAGKSEIEKQYAMNGFVLNDENVLDGMTGGHDTKVIGGRLLSNGAISFSGSKVLKEKSDFENFKETVYNNIKIAAIKITDGDYKISPAITSDISPCKYCHMRSLCANCSSSAEM